MLICLVWLVFSVLCYGLSFAHFQRNFPFLANSEYWSDLTFCLIMSIMGPISLIAFIAANYSCGYNLRGFKFY